MKQWLSLSGAAEYLDVSNDTISWRAVPWSDEPVSGMIRWKSLKLGEGTRQERRYFVEDLEAPFGEGVTVLLFFGDNEIIYWAGIQQFSRPEPFLNPGYLEHYPLPYRAPLVQVNHVEV